MGSKVLIKQIVDRGIKQGVPLYKIMYSALAYTTEQPDSFRNMPTDVLFATYFKIKTKSGRLEPLILNKVQWNLLLNLSGRDIVLKSRQEGVSTFIQALIYKNILLKHGFTATTVANEAGNTAHMLDIFDRYHYNMSPDMQPFKKGRYPNAIRFPDRDSILYMGTAGNRQWGRSKTIQFLHASEVAFWPSPKTVMDGLLESIPRGGKEKTYAIMESTPNGAGGYFYEAVMESIKGESGWRLHFFPWWWADEYKTPLSPQESIILTSKEEALIQRIQAEEGITLSHEQIKWRRLKIQTLREQFWQEYPEDIYTCFLLSGRPRFNQEALNARINECRPPIWEDYPTAVKGVTKYMVKYYEKPLKGHDYIIGADTAEGISINTSGDTDFSAAVVRDRRTNNRVATIHGRLEPFAFAYLLSETGKDFNYAKIGVERNNHGHAVLGYLIHGTGDKNIRPYPNIYVFDEDERPGWPTTSKTRPMMIDDLALEYASPNSGKIYDRDIIGEGLSFVVKANGRAEANDGAHDDLIFADGIAGQIRNRPQVERQVIYNPVKIGDF